MKHNPFLITGYKSPEYFCDREIDSDKLRNALENQRNITLISSRRMGKKGLIRHVFNLLSSNTTIVPIYFDIMATTGFDEFVEVFSNAVFLSLSKSEARWKEFLKKLAALRPVLGFDSLTGEPRITLDIRSEQEIELTLELVFKLMDEKKQSFVIAIDEFQQISSYPEKNVEAILRTHIQKQTNISFIFSGSKKHMLSEMFSQPSRPFFSSTQMMFLGVNKKVSSREVNDTLYTILRENEPIYANYLNLLTITQYKTLRAIALEGSVENPTSGKFLSKHQLAAASSVSQAVSSLTGKEFIHNDAGRLSVQDKFFAQWIRSK